MLAWRLDATTSAAPSLPAASATASPIPEVPPSMAMRFPFSVMFFSPRKFAQISLDKYAASSASLSSQ
jgi:hypothetical protein